jgi:hypothetical protein
MSMDRRDEIRERFEREADFVRGAGGHVTTDDLRAYGEQMAYASLPSREDEQAAWDGSLESDLEVELGWQFAARHDGFRNEARSTITRLREVRKRLTEYHAKREEMM